MQAREENCDDDRFSAALAEYLLLVDRGEAVSRDVFLAAHPECRQGLAQYFADVDLIEGAAGRAQTQHGPSMLDRAEFGDYQLLEIIGRGGTGVVYRARECSTGRVVALKRLLHSSMLSAAEVQRFRREARTAAGLRHPGILPVYHVGEERGQLFYTMPFIAGRSLAERLAAGPLELREAAQLLSSVADAVDFAHGCGIVHRDLKPANVLVDEREGPFVADFGLARSLADEPLSVTATGDLIGTPNYMAPEQINGHRSLIGPPADVYAMGALLYALLVGQPPFHSESVAVTLQKACTSPPVLPRRLRRDIPRDLETVCLKCLEKNPSHRYGSAAELAEDLRRFLRGEPPRVRRASPLERSRRWFVRNPDIGFLAAGLVLVLAVGIVVSLYYSSKASRRAEEAQASLYAANMNVAQQHVERGNIANALRVLETYATSSVGGSDGPGWEWRHLWRQCHGELRRFTGPKKSLSSAAFSPDGRSVAAAGEDRLLWIWETATGKVLHRLSGHQAAISGLAYAPDGRRLATVDEQGVAIVWDAENGRQVGRLPEAQPLKCVAFNRDGQYIATAGNAAAGVSIWHANTLELQRVLDLGPAEKLAFSPRDVALAVASADGCIRICRQGVDGTWRLSKTIEAHANVVRDVAWSSDGRRLVTGSSDGMVKMWDVESGAQLAVVEAYGDAIYSIALRPDARRIAIAGRNSQIKIWDVDQNRVGVECTGHTGLVKAIAFCPMGWRLISASEDGTVRLWSAARSTGHDRLEGHGSRVRAIDYSPDGQTIATGAVNDPEVILWNATTGQPRNVFVANTSGNHDVEFSPDGGRLATATHDRLQVFRVATGRLIVDARITGTPLGGLAWFPDGERLVIQDNDGVVWIVRASDGERLASWRVPSPPEARLALSPDGKFLATAGKDGVVRVWDVVTHSVREFVGHSRPVVNVAFNHDGTILASSAIDSTIRLWNLGSGSLLKTLVGHSGTSHAIAFSSDGSRIVSGGTDGLIKVWDVSTGSELQSLDKAEDWVLDVAFSPDGRHIASAVGDKGVYLWHGGPLPHDWLASREAASLVAHLAWQAGEGNTFPTSDLMQRRVLSQIAVDTTINESVRESAARQAKKFLYYWPFKCEGDRWAELHCWSQAVTAFSRAASLEPNDTELWYSLALVSAAAGRLDAYRRAYNELLNLYEYNGKTLTAARALEAWALLPNDRAEAERLTPLVALFKARPPESYVLPLLEHRRGHSFSSAQLTRHPLRDPNYDFSLALAFLSAGDSQRATAAYQAGARKCRSGTANMWRYWALSTLLKKQVEQALPPEIKSNLLGDESEQ